MAKQELLSAAGKGGSVELDPAVFEAPVRPHLFHAEVRRQLARRQRGTHSTRNRAGVSGGGVKPWRQKGTGRARQGSIRSPQWAGGGAVFGPVPRSHAHELPKKVRRAALCGALSLRRGEGKLLAVETLSLAEAKTRQMADFLAKLGFDGSESVLIVIDCADPAVERAARNLPWASVLRAEGLNTYDVLRHDRLLVTRAALDAIHTRLGRRDVESDAQPRASGDDAPRDAGAQSGTKQGGRSRSSSSRTARRRKAEEVGS